MNNKRRKAIYRRDGFQCVLCGYPETLQLHHAIPRGQGGADTESNVITLCSRCHQAAHGFKVEGWPEPEEIMQSCIEYLADYYTDENKTWNPWEKDTLND